MNQDIKTQKDLKALLGVTFTKNMSAADVLEAWGRVPAAIKSQLPSSITTAMDSASVLITTEETLRTVYATANDVYVTATETLDDATSAIYTGGAVTTARVAEEVAKVAETQLDNQVNNLGSTLVSQLTALVG